MEDNTEIINAVKAAIVEYSNVIGEINDTTLSLSDYKESLLMKYMDKGLCWYFIVKYTSIEEEVSAFLSLPSRSHIFATPDDAKTKTELIKCLRYRLNYMKEHLEIYNTRPKNQIVEIEYR